MENLFINQEIILKVNIIIIKEMDQENINIKMEMFLKVILKMMNLLKVHLIFRMEKNMKENLKEKKEMEKGE